MTTGSWNKLSNFIVILDNLFVLCAAKKDNVIIDSRHLFKAHVDNITRIAIFYLKILLR